jgi:hypothetical protein
VLSRLASCADMPDGYKTFTNIVYSILFDGCTRVCVYVARLVAVVAAAAAALMH